MKLTPGRLKEIREKTKEIQRTPEPEINSCKTKCLNLHELEDALTKLKLKKAPGPDGFGVSIIAC